MALSDRDDARRPVEGRQAFAAVWCDQHVVFDAHAHPYSGKYTPGSNRENHPRLHHSLIAFASVGRFGARTGRGRAPSGG